MISSLFNSTSIPVLQEVVGFSQARHEVLVGNIANLDTPGYRTRDYSVDAFHEKLQKALEARDRKSEPISPGLAASQPGDPLREVNESLNSILFHDDSNVSLEHQVAELNKNQYLHNVAISVLSSQFRLLQTAISERV